MGEKILFTEGGLKGKPNCLAIGLANGNIVEKGKSYQVKTVEGKTCYFVQRLGAEKMFYLLDDDGYWNGQTYDEVFHVK